ncbi:MAG TPA: hydroxyisourate hydrolase [Streptosporangiaceae bacterium]
MTSISTHILDTARGRPAEDVPVTLDTWADGGWQRLAAAVTGADGRIASLASFGSPGQARCRLVFAVGGYLRAQHGPAFFPEITVVFDTEPGEHYHVPLLLTPYGYAVYRGS